ncbi:hypothetical protein MWU75_07490 [Ornithinimicrobium sp. F0845]|uniref:hypothetical protein n=1 Tax=Ornithinimicrobium sp. F0845 TaxID=2926412 RepID=UPI001FF3388A|nr:hypothetical protein [Ornithinimicrobium sp. F0845]MCK0111977.1 hypothetical protein [Ornithinimicrobium sp. F0845]
MTTTLSKFRALTVLFATVALMLGLAVAPSSAVTPAAAAGQRHAPSALSSAVVEGAFDSVPTVSGECKNGRCVVKLSKAETKAMGAGSLIKVPKWVPTVIRPVLTMSIKVHAWIAKQYAKKGLCSQFVLDIRPWASQGYMSRKC